METKNIIKNSLRLCAFFLVLIGLRTSAFAALDCSSNYCLDFGGVTFGSENFQSGSFEVQSGTAPIETNSDSDSFKIATINLLPICGDDIVDPWEQCDGANLNGLTCTDFGFDLGPLSCKPTCLVDTSQCYYHSVPLPPPPTPRPDPDPDPEEPEEPEEPEVPEEPEEPTEPEVIIPEEVEEVVVGIDDLWTIPAIAIPKPKPLIVEIEEKEKIIQWGIVIDETLFVADNLEYLNPEEPSQDYTIRVVTPEGIIIHSQDITTDTNGNFVFEYETPVEDGKYLIYVYDEDNYFVKSYPVNLVEQEVEDFRVKTFADQEGVVNDFLRTIDLEKIRPYDEQTMIKGTGLDGSKVTAYFIKDGEIIIVKTFVDCYNEWKIEIPEELGIGEHKVYIVEEYPDGLLTKDLTYTFEITDKCGYCVLIIFLLIFIFFIVHHYYELPDKKDRQKFLNKIKKYFSRMFVLVLVLAILPIKPGLTSVPQFLIYEGRLLDNSGYILNTPHTFRFSFWTVSDKIATDVDAFGALNTLAANYAGWTEVQTITPNNNGTFSIELGSITSLPTIDYTFHKFLQVEIKAAGEADSAYELMDPTGDNGGDTDDRKILGSVPYSYVAESAQWSNDENFTLDHDNTIETAGTGSIELQFGDTLGRILSYDTDNSYFNFNDDVNIEGDLTITGTINGVDITTLGALRPIAATFEPEYDSSSVYADGTDNRGKLETFAIDLGGVDKINLYQWTTKQNTQQDFDIVISFQLPNSFDSFTAAPMSLKYRTSDAVLATNRIDATLFDSTGTAVTLTGADSLANASWTTANITFGGSPTFTAGDTVTIHIKLSTDRTGFAQISDLVLNYNGLE